MEIEFVGGSMHGRIKLFDQPMPRLQVPKPATVALSWLTDPPVRHPVFVDLETYELARRFVSADGPVETVYVEQQFYRAELRAQETRESRDRMEALALLQFGALPDPRMFVKLPYMRAEIWRCGDPVCDCSQARVIGWTGAYTIDGEPAEWPSRFGELVLPYAYVDGQRVGPYAELWQGRFLSEGEPGAADDLLVLHSYLEEVAGDLIRQISWPWARR